MEIWNSATQTDFFLLSLRKKMFLFYLFWFWLLINTFDDIIARNNMPHFEYFPHYIRLESYKYPGCHPSKLYICDRFVSVGVSTEVRFFSPYRKTFLLQCFSVVCTVQPATHNLEYKFKRNPAIHNIHPHSFTFRKTNWKYKIKTKKSPGTSMHIITSLGTTRVSPLKLCRISLCFYFLSILCVLCIFVCFYRFFPSSTLFPSFNSWTLYAFITLARCIILTI